MRSASLLIVEDEKGERFDAHRDRANVAHSEPIGAEELMESV
jgi:hypothetical protein